jgi:N-acetylglucosaminyl-diphospho-decaprenol L-rhamnosyltransferase
MCYNPRPMGNHLTAVSPTAFEQVNGSQSVMRAGQPAQATLVAPEPEGQSSAETDLGIVILSYNTVGLLRNCLRSVLNCQGIFRYQVCVVDNASSDGSVEMVRSEFPGVRVLVLRTNLGYSAGNNVGLRWFGFADEAGAEPPLRAPRYLLLLNSDTLVPPTTFAEMLAFLDSHPQIGVAGPRVRLPDGTLDRACRRSFPTPRVSFYRLTGLSRLFAANRRFNAYNLAYLPEDAVHPVDSVVGAYMQLRRETIAQVGLLDERFFMYGEDLDWAKRIKDAGWEIWYNGQSEMTHVKRASSSQSSKTRIDFYEAMWLFYAKHYRRQTPWLVDRLIPLGVAARGGLDVALHLWRFCRQRA